MLLEQVHKKFKINRTKIKGSCQSGRKVVIHDPKSDLPLDVGMLIASVVLNPTKKVLLLG